MQPGATAIEDSRSIVSGVTAGLKKGCIGAAHRNDLLSGMLLGNYETSA
jgi:hypothetical protein